MAKTHMCLGILQGTVVLMTGVSLVYIMKLGDGARVCTQARHYFATYITTVDWH